MSTTARVWGISLLIYTRNTKEKYNRTVFASRSQHLNSRLALAHSLCFLIYISVSPRILQYYEIIKYYLHLFRPYCKMNWYNSIINRGSQSSNTVTDVNAIQYNQGIICHEYEVMIQRYLKYACMDNALSINPSVHHAKLKNLNHWPDLDQLFMQFC